MNLENKKTKGKRKLRRKSCKHPIKPFTVGQHISIADVIDFTQNHPMPGQANESNLCADTLTVYIYEGNIANGNLRIYKAVINEGELLLYTVPFNTEITPSIINNLYPRTTLQAKGITDIVISG